MYNLYITNKNPAIIREKIRSSKKMITGEIKNKIDNIWQKLWAAGMANPLTCIEQLSYLMFIRSRIHFFRLPQF